MMYSPIGYFLMVICVIGLPEMAKDDRFARRSNALRQPPAQVLTALS